MKGHKMKWLLFGGLGIGMVVGMFWFHEPLPQIDPRTQSQADTWAKKIEQAINKDAWDKTDIVTWTFVGRHHHIWDKKRKLHMLRKGDQTVIQSLHSRNSLNQKKEQDWSPTPEHEKERAYIMWC